MTSPCKRCDPANKLAVPAILRGFLGSTCLVCPSAKVAEAQRAIIANRACRKRVEASSCFNRDLSRILSVPDKTVVPFAGMRFWFKTWAATWVYTSSTAEVRAVELLTMLLRDGRLEVEQHNELKKIQFGDCSLAYHDLSHVKHR